MFIYFKFYPYLPRCNKNIIVHPIKKQSDQQIKIIFIGDQIFEV